jgi:hypothetical protein
MAPGQYDEACMKEKRYFGTLLRKAKACVEPRCNGLADKPMLKLVSRAKTRGWPPGFGVTMA